MKKMMKYALVALLAVAMILSFTSCSDDNDDDAAKELTDTEIVTLVASGLVTAITDNYQATDSSSATSTYSTWSLGQTGVTITTTSEYSGKAALDESGTTYDVAIGTGSTISVTYIFSEDNTSIAGYSVSVSVDASVDGVDEDLALTYDPTGTTSTSLTINSEAAEVTETELTALISGLITGVTGAMNAQAQA